MFQLKTNVSCVKTQEVVKNLFLFDRGSNYLENTWSTDKSWWKIEHLLLQSTVTTYANFSSDHDQEDDDDDWEQIMVSVNTVLIDQVIRSQWKINKNMSGLACKATMIFEIIFLFAGKMKVSQNKSKKSIEICTHVMQRCWIIWNQWKYLDSSHH